MSASLTSSAQGANIFGTIGQVVSGIGMITQGKQEKSMGDYNASIYEQQAQSERNSQVLLEQQKRKVIKSQLGTQTAAYAKSGIKMSGSPLEVALDSLTNANMDIAIDKYNSEVKARGYESSAAMAKYEAKQQASRSYTKGAVSLLSTAADIYKSQREIGGTKKK